MRQKSIIPVLSLSDVKHAFAIADIACKHGFCALEITLRTPQGLEIISALKKHYGKDLTVLCGTIRTPEQVSEALDAGADYLVSPGVTPKLLPAIAENKDIFFAGITTISEAMTLSEAGLRQAKLFPAELVGGIKFLKSIEVLLPEMKFFPTGGIDASKCQDYLRLENVIHVGGTWFTANDADLKTIEANFATTKPLMEL